MSVTSDYIRKSFRESDDVRDAGLTTPKEIVRYDNLIYGVDPAWQVLDVYRPVSEDGNKLPVIVSIHGGGWVYGDKERYQYYCMDLALRGFAVVNFTYRLAPEFQFPASLEDTNLVFAWILEHKKEYGFDAEHIFAVGDSAGAHMLGIYSAICTNTEYASEFSFRVPEGFVPKAIALNCGVYQISMKHMKPDGLTTLLMADYLPEKGSPKELELLNILEHITEQFPPVFFMTAEGDFLKSEAGPLSERLMEKNIPFVYRYYKSAERELQHVFHCNIRLPEAKLCNDEECRFFRGFVKE